MNNSDGTGFDIMLYNLNLL